MDVDAETQVEVKQEAAPTVPVEEGGETQPCTDLALAAKCHKCGCKVTAENASSAKGSRHTQVACKNCICVTAMLQRHLGGMPDEWSLMEREQQMNFFKSCLTLKDERTSSFSYSKVRALLVNSLVEKKTSSEVEAYGGAFHPLSYWEKLGYDVKVIEANAPREEHEFLGTVYQVKIHSGSNEQRRDQVEESLLNCERACKKRKKPSLALPKGKAKAKAKAELPDEQKALEDSLAQLEDLQTDSEDENFTAACLHVLCFCLA